MSCWPGTPYPLGSTYDGSGTNFAVFSEVAEQGRALPVRRRRHRDPAHLPEVDAFVWHGYLPNIGPGQRYGFRVHGPYEPENGHRCNPAKLLLDPYAKAVDGSSRLGRGAVLYKFAYPDDLNDRRQRAAHDEVGRHQPVLRLGQRPRTQTPYNETVIYEAHVKGLTKTHPGIPEELRGTYSGHRAPGDDRALQEAGHHRR